MYPKITIDIEKLQHNAKTLLALCHKNDIPSVFLVGKVLAGHVEILEHLASLGFTYLADSRLQNLKKATSIHLPKALLRIPMLSEVEEMVKIVDCCLVSELATIKAIAKAAEKYHKVIDLILMFDLGDLREGIYYTESYNESYFDIVKTIINYPSLHLKGIGTNLTCYGGIIPDQTNMKWLISIKHQIEAGFHIPIELVSGGNSSSIRMIASLPEEVNSLRLGEAIFLGRETAYGTPIAGCFQDAFTLEVEVIESQNKPSVPVGTSTMNAFGEVPRFIDYGIQRRLILALGRQDVDYRNLTSCNPGVSLLASSSDHLIALCNRVIAVGEILKFYPNYGGLLQLMTSPYVKKELIKGSNIK
jgi:predicted amino acid racemase